MAKAMSSYKHFEADHYFEQAGIYKFDGAKIDEAHIWCAARVKDSLLRGENVVVSNTFSRLCEMEKYLTVVAESGCRVRIIEATGKWQNTHGIPEAKIVRMQERWEQVTQQDVEQIIMMKKGGGAA